MRKRNHASHPFLFAIFRRGAGGADRCRKDEPRCRCRADQENERRRCATAHEPTASDQETKRKVQMAHASSSLRSSGPTKGRLNVPTINTPQ